MPFILAAAAHYQGTTTVRIPTLRGGAHATSIPQLSEQRLYWFSCDYDCVA